MLTIGVYWDMRGTRPGLHTGVGKHVLHVVDGLRRMDEIRIVVLVARDQIDLWRELLAEKGWQDLEARKIPWPCLGVRLWGVIGDLPGLRKLVDDCAVIYSPQEELLTCRGLPSVNTLHGFPALHENILPALARSLPYRRERWKQRALMRRVKRKCCCSFVVSQVLAEEAAGRFGISSAKLRLVGNGVESSFFREELASRPDKKASLLQVGGLNDYDGADWVLPLIEALPEYSVNIVGNRHESPWESRARDLQNVSFSGFVTGSAYRNALREAQALLFLPKAESFGIIGLEALALGVPVIAHRVDGLPETLGDCAFWVEKPEADAVRDALSRIDGLSDAEYRSWQERGLRRAASFTWDKVVDRVREGLELCV